ncbi:ABC transporter ATP-binding protein (plasmid) [Streptomyces sp. BI20]|uniref:ABC transporter ATP-binding protein n=1 Tax=Streptomyces sp. BI20 TaxID=3403460 RepID=UPI003C78C6E9
MTTPTTPTAPVPVLDVDGLRITLPGLARPLVDGVHLTVAPGETVALVGESGSGKSLTSRAALGLLPPGASTTGTVRVAGRDVLAMAPAERGRLRADTAAMVFQDPRAAVNPLRRIGDFMTESVVLTGAMSRAHARARAAELLRSVGLDETLLRARPGQVSGGMLQRVVIAAALMGSPALLLADEPTTALDAAGQAEAIALLTELRRAHGTGMLFVTHDLDLAAAVADRVYVMYAGRIAETGPADALFRRPRHPYTAALLACGPRLDGPRGRLPVIEGLPPDPREPLPGCAFAARCGHATEICDTRAPDTTPAPDRPAQRAACHHADRLEGSAPRAH